jgi:hypothetical protein
MKKKRNITKLTPAILKRIIQEEKDRINIARRKIESKKRKSSKKNSKKVKIALRETRKKQVELVKQFKKLHMLRERIKRLKKQ